MTTVLIWIAAAAVLLPFSFFFVRGMVRRRRAYLAHLSKIEAGLTLVSLVRDETDCTYDWHAYYSDGTYVSLYGHHRVQPEWTNGIAFDAVGQGTGFKPENGNNSWTRGGFVLEPLSEQPAGK